MAEHTTEKKTSESMQSNLPITLTQITPHLSSFSGNVCHTPAGIVFLECWAYGIKEEEESSGEWEEAGKKREEERRGRNGEEEEE